MTIERGASALATAALLLVAVTACAGSGNDPSPTATQTTSPSSTKSTTPPSDSEVASQAATAAVRKFYAVRNRLRQNPKQPLDLLGTVAISTELATQQNLFKRERKDGLRQTGDTKIAELEVQAVSLDNSDPSAGKAPTVQIDVCFDVSGVDLINANGESVVSGDRPDAGWIRYLVSNYEWDSDPAGTWRVASSQDIKRSPCAVS